MSTRPRFVSAGGHELEVLAHAGSRRGTPTLVFLHEGLGSAAGWRELPERLGVATGCAALAYSRYGHGGSAVLSEPRAVSFMHLEAAVLDELLTRLQVSAPILVGHSDGGSIALIHAATAASPTAPRALVVLAPHVFVEERTIAAIAEARDAFATTDLALRLGRHHRDPLRTFRGWNDVWLDPAFCAWDIRPLLERVACPVLAIQGHDDAYGTMAQLDEIAVRVNGPLTQVRLPRCGHAPQRDEPEAVAAAIAHFVDQLAARAAG